MAIAAGSQRAYSQSSCAIGQTNGRIALFQNASPYGRGIITLPVLHEPVIFVALGAIPDDKHGVVEVMCA